jgi:hypothetical protein
VIVTGTGPALVYDRSFRDATPPAPGALAKAVRDPSGHLAPDVLQPLPSPDIAFDQPCPEVRYLRRRLADADVYFLFNEGEETQQRQVTLRGRGSLQIWDAATGSIAVTGVIAENGRVRTTIELKPGAARILVIATSAPAVAMGGRPD